jgi:hypothetical protein
MQGIIEIKPESQIHKIVPTELPEREMSIFTDAEECLILLVDDDTERGSFYMGIIDKMIKLIFCAIYDYAKNGNL